MAFTTIVDFSGITVISDDTDNFIDLNMIPGVGVYNRVYAGSGNDVIIGSSGRDYINAGSGKNTIYGGAGNDVLVTHDGPALSSGSAIGSLGLALSSGSITGPQTLYGGAGDDYLIGASGNDKLFGGSGNDNLIGNDGNDHLDGGTGDDYLSGNKGNDVLKGGAGNDHYLFTRGEGRDSIQESTSNPADIDTAYLGLGDSSQLVYFRKGNDLILGYKDGGGEQITIRNQFVGTSGIEFLKTRGLEFPGPGSVSSLGSTVSASQIEMITNQVAALNAGKNFVNIEQFVAHGNFAGIVFTG
jgi:Ca2+-binding RTX toxin-like protein